MIRGGGPSNRPACPRRRSPPSHPPRLPRAQQRRFSSRQRTAIEINATFYKLQRPELFERWADTAPDGFVFAVKGSRFCTNRKLLAEGEEAIARFCGQGFTKLGPKLGPILWQLAATEPVAPGGRGARCAR